MVVDCYDAPADKQSQFYCVNTHRQPFRAQAPLPIPKLWQSNSVASYILSLFGKGKGLVRD